MKTTIFLVVVIVIGLVWINGQPTLKQPPVVILAHAVYHPDHLRTEPPDEGHRYGDLQLYPVYGSYVFLKHHQHLGPYLSLQEALGQKKIIITEIQGDNTNAQNSQQNGQQEQPADEDLAEVNTLFIQNVSADTIIILGGEVVRGGKQDRMIARDFMVMPHSDKIDVSVFCVEHGRWSAEESMTFQMSLDVAPNKVRKASTSHKAQEKVWEEVANLSENIDVESPAGALAYALEDGKFKDSIQLYKDRLQKIDWSGDVVGVIAVKGNEIVGCDIFAQHQLFIKYYPSLLSSYCSEAYQASTAVQLPYSDVQAFLHNLIQNEETLEVQIAKKGTQLKHGKYRIHLAAY